MDQLNFPIPVPMSLLFAEEKLMVVSPVSERRTRYLGESTMIQLPSASWSPVGVCWNPTNSTNSVYAESSTISMWASGGVLSALMSLV